MLLDLGIFFSLSKFKQIEKLCPAGVFCCCCCCGFFRFFLLASSCIYKINCNEIKNLQNILICIRKLKYIFYDYMVQNTNNENLLD